VSVRHAMLALLSEGPKYGLQLREEFEARTGDIWPLNVGQVYTTLQRLERDGLVESDDAEDQLPASREKGYRITGSGLQELETWLRTPPDLSAPPRDELVMKVLVSLRVPGAVVPDIIQAHRRYLVQLMQQWTHIKEEADPADLNLGLAVDAEIFRLDSVVRWLDAADVRIKRAAADQAADAADGTTPTGAGSPAQEQWRLPRLRPTSNREVRTRR
jgi:DNA-binding PadR family transcriptional regulator